MGHTFLLGPLGAMVPLPSPVADGFDAPYQRTAAVQHSLTGAATVDVLGVHRVWQFIADWRHAAEMRRVIAHWTSPLLSAPLRLVDPLTANRLSLDAASGGGVSGDVDALTATVGELTRLIFDVMPAELAGLLDGGYRVTYGDGESGDILLDPEQPAPVVDGDEALVLRLWVRGGEVDVLPLVQWIDEAGATTDLVGAPVALSQPAGWQLVELSGQFPAGTVAARGGLRIPEGSGDERRVDLTGAVLATTAVDEWEPGGGAPVVVLDEFDHAYRRLGRRGITLTVREA